MAKYRKKPVIIEAVKWTGDNTLDICLFMDKTINVDKIAGIESKLNIATLEGNMKASRGDYIIKGVNGEFYPCKPDIFDKTYEPAEKEALEVAEAVVSTINKMQKQVKRSSLNI